jgi:hypothetical protein
MALTRPLQPHGCSASKKERMNEVPAAPQTGALSISCLFLTEIPLLSGFKRSVFRNSRQNNRP